MPLLSPIYCLFLHCLFRVCLLIGFDCQLLIEDRIEPDWNEAGLTESAPKFEEIEKMQTEVIKIEEKYEDKEIEPSRGVIGLKT